MDAKAAKAHALDMIKALDIRCTGPEQYSGRLSGGNQQKVCLARAITMEPKLLIVSDGKLTGIFTPDASDADYGLAMSGVTEGGKI